ncbi:GlcG/HbpS family heme-binding protein [Hyphococcus sp.]|uniref:GlcG/HbpS family heme-binding protein n=1 Tax=Hyphococcus sp. TaxID=2038636 RepID=UPI0035C6AEC2
MTITGECADAVLSAVTARANDLGVWVSVAIADCSGHLLAFKRMQGAFLPTVEIAIDKAKTAAGFGIDTGLLYELLKNNSAVVSGIGKREGIALFGGGVAISIENGSCAGSIGVSGGSEEQDIECAKAGLEAISALSNK